MLFCLDNVPETYGKEQLKDAIVELLVTKPSKCVAELKCHLQKDNTILPGISFGFDCTKENESRHIFSTWQLHGKFWVNQFYWSILQSIQVGLSTPWYTFDIEYCIPEDRNIPIQDIKIRLLYNGWNHFTPFFPQRVAEIIRKGQPMLKKVAKAFGRTETIVRICSQKRSLLKKWTAKYDRTFRSCW